VLDGDGGVKLMAALISNHQGNVVVFGASGHTGRFVVAELEWRAMKAVLVGRDVANLSKLAPEHPGFEVRLLRWRTLHRWIER